MAMGRFVPLAVAAAASSARAEKQAEQDASIIGEFERPGLNFKKQNFALGFRLEKLVLEVLVS